MTTDHAATLAAHRARRARKIDAFCALSSAASQSIDLRRAAAGTPPGSPARIAAADAQTALSDRRIAHTLACAGTRPDVMSRDGLVLVEHVPEVRAARARIEAAEETARLALLDSPQ